MVNLNPAFTSFDLNNALLTVGTNYEVKIEITTNTPANYDNLVTSNTKTVYVSPVKAYAMTFTTIDMHLGQYDVHISTTAGDTVTSATYSADFGSGTVTLATVATPDSNHALVVVPRSYLSTTVVIHAAVTNSANDIVPVSYTLALVKNLNPLCGSFCTTCTTNNDNTACDACDSPRLTLSGTTCSGT